MTRFIRQVKQRRLVASSLALFVLIVVSTGGASAGGWCRSDPDVLLEGSLVKVEVSVPEEYQHLVNGPIYVRFNIPSAVDRELIATDAGINGHGYDVIFPEAYNPNDFDAEFKVNLMVKVPIAGNTKVPLLIEVTTDDGRYYSVQGNDADTGKTINFTVYGNP